MKDGCCLCITFVRILAHARSLWSGGDRLSLDPRGCLLGHQTLFLLCRVQINLYNSVEHLRVRIMSYLG